MVQCLRVTRVGVWMVAGALGAQLVGCATSGSARDDAPATPLAWATQDAHALVWADARLHFEPDGASAVRAFDFGEDGRAGRLGHVFRVRVMDRQDGWTKISTALDNYDRHCIGHGAIGDDALGLTFWVRDDDLVPALSQPVTRVFGDGTQVALRAGTPVFDGRPWAYGFALPITLDDDAFGDVYTTDPAELRDDPPPAAQGQPARAFDYKRVTLKAAQVNGARAPWSRPPWYSDEGVMYGDVASDSGLFHHTGGCGALMLGLPSEAVTEDVSISGLMGAMVNSGHIRAGAALSWRDGTPAGHARDALYMSDTARVEATEARVCWEQPIGDAWDAPGHRGDKVVFCAQRADIVSAKANPPASPSAPPREGPLLTVTQADALFADPATRANEATTAPPANAPSLVALGARYRDAKRAFDAAMASGDIAALKTHIKRLADFQALYLSALQSAPKPIEQLHLSLALADLQWDIARGLQTASLPPGVAESSDATAQYRGLLTTDYVRPLLFKALQAYRRAETLTDQHQLPFMPTAQARLRILKTLEAWLKP